MIDPLAEIVSLLQPQATFSKRVCANGRWRHSLNASAPMGAGAYIVLKPASRSIA